MEEEVDVVLKADNLNQSYSNQQEIIRTVYLVTSNRTFYWQLPAQVSWDKGRDNLLSFKHLHGLFPRIVPIQNKMNL